MAKGNRNRGLIFSRILPSGGEGGRDTGTMVGGKWTLGWRL